MTMAMRCAVRLCIADGFGVTFDVPAQCSLLRAAATHRTHAAIATPAS